MAKQAQRVTMMYPPIEDLFEKVDSKFTLVSLSAKRARQINSYFGQLGDSLGAAVPPQVTSVARKPLSIAFEEIGADKIKGTWYDADALAAEQAAAAAAETEAEPEA